MSQENVEVLLRGFEAWQGGDPERLEAWSEEHLDPAFELHTLYFDRVYMGVQALRDFVADVSETWEDYVLEPQETLDLGENVMGVIRMSGRGGGSGVPVTRVIAMLWTFRGDKLISSRAFGSREQALEAVGLRE
jgi:ketosteroid isomerase-like protein